jgi:hypothetical protein
VSTIRIPRTAESRRELTYARLLCRVHPEREMANAFEGVLLKPGCAVEHAALWPDSRYPEKPLLLEFAGTDHTGRGHNRSNQIHVLWRYEPARGVWVQLARTLSQAADWIPQMKVMALRELGGPPAPDPLIASKAASVFLARLDLEFGELGAGDRHIAMNLVFEQLLARMVNA